MALKVWLPLNKSTKNFGLFNSKPIPNNVELSTGGVFNNCYKFSNNTNSYIDANIKTSDLFEDNASYSVAFWVKLSAYPSTTPGGIFGSNKYISEQTTGNYKGGGFGVLLYSNYINIIHANSTTNQGKQVNNIPLNTWLHIAICYNNNGNIVRCYVNGEKRLETTFKINYSTNGSGFIIGRNSQGGCTNPSEKYINDFRIYDHCISESDVERLYQCKVFGIDSHGWSTDTFVADTFDGYRQAKPVNIVATPSALKFNGNSYIDTEGISMTGGTLSAWFTMSAIPTTNSNIIYCDQKSKMAIGFYSGNKLIVTCNGLYGNTYIHSNKLLANKWNNVTIVYNKSDGKPSICYINGSQATSSATNYWTSTGEILSIGRRYGGSSPNYFNGSIGKIDVYSKSFTENEILEKYESEKNLFLPDDYIQLEYIESNTGQTCYINTGVKINESNCNKLRIEVDGNFGTNTQWRVDGLSNTFSSTRTTRYIGLNSSSKLSYGNQDDVSTTYTETDLNGRHLYVVDYKNGYLKRDNVVIASFTSYNYTHTFESDLFIFAWKSDSTRQKSAKKYGVKIYLDSIIQFNGVPAKRKSDNVIGLYDMVSRQFFTNSGTGSFTGA